MTTVKPFVTLVDCQYVEFPTGCNRDHVFIQGIITNNQHYCFPRNHIVTIPANKICGGGVMDNFFIIETIDTMWGINVNNVDVTLLKLLTSVMTFF